MIEVRGLDAIDGTPVLDIKPYFAEFAPRGDVTQPEWTHELMAQYWLATPEAAATPSIPSDGSPWCAIALPITAGWT